MCVRLVGHLVRIRIIKCYLENYKKREHLKVLGIDGKTIEVY
jgi:hypothetical protein